MTDDTELLVGHKAIARFLNVTPRFVSWHDEKGELPTFMVGARVCATKAAIRQWLADKQREGKQKKAS